MNTFEGHFVADKKCGRGKFQNINTNYYYIGEYADNKKQGYGLEVHSNGDYYEGFFKNGLRSGIGTFIWTQS